MQDFRNLQVWRKAHDLTLLVYRLTVDFPKDEIFGLRTQMRKTAVDAASMIAEGSARESDGEFAKCVATALGYVKRLEYFALVASDLQLITAEVYSQLQESIVEVEKMLSSFYQTLRRG
jgi:four helix bundle protein